MALLVPLLDRVSGTPAPARALLAGCVDTLCISNLSWTNLSVKRVDSRENTRSTPPLTHRRERGAPPHGTRAAVGLDTGTVTPGCGPGFSLLSKRTPVMDSRSQLTLCSN